MQLFACAVFKIFKNIKKNKNIVLGVSGTGEIIDNRHNI